MGLCSTPEIPNPADAAMEGIAASDQLQPYQYLINAAATLGNRITLDGHTYDFSGLGNADTSRVVSDQMAQTLLALQRERSPEIIAQRIEELKAADPQGYAARKQLFDRIMADAQENPNRPIATDLQNQLKDELSKGAGFNDAKQEEEVREGVRGGQVSRGIYLGNAPTSQEAKTVVNAGESLQSQRQQNALSLLESGASPEDVAYRRMQQNLANLGNFQSGQTPTAQFQQVGSSANGPVSLTGQAPGTNTFNPNAAGQGMSNALGVYSGQMNYAQNSANPWLAGIGVAGQAGANMYNAGWFNGTPQGPGLTQSQYNLGFQAPNYNPGQTGGGWGGG